jgi:hypothetical protein
MAPPVAWVPLPPLPGPAHGFVPPMPMLMPHPLPVRMPLPAHRPLPATVVARGPVCETAACVSVVHNAQAVHLVTPHFEARCERMTGGAGDRLVLEGDVQLTCKKHGQDIRIAAARVVVDVKEGTFTVESGRAATAAAHPGVYHIVPAGGQVIRSVHIVPVPAAPQE